MTKWPGTRSLLLFLALHKVGFFRISLFTPYGIGQIKRRACGKSNSFWWCKCYSTIWSSSQEHSKNVFAVNADYRDNVYMYFVEKHSDLENQTRLQNSTYTTRKSLIFLVLCALFEQIPSGINRDILKNPTWCGAINSDKLRAHCHLVMCNPHTGYCQDYYFSSCPSLALFGMVCVHMVCNSITSVGLFLHDKQ